MDIEESDDDRHLGPVHARGRDSSSHPDDQNHSTSTDLNRLLNSTACNVSLGVVLLLIGVVVTSMTFKEYRATNKIFLLGPILVGAGVLGIGKALLKKYHVGEVRHRGRRRRHSRNNRLSRASHSERTDSDSAVYGESGDPIYRSRRGAPPPYDIVAIVTSTSALLPSSQIIGVHVPALPNYSELDPLPPPPKYEEAVQGVSVSTNMVLEEEQTEPLNSHRNGSTQQEQRIQSSSSTITSATVQTQTCSTTTIITPPPQLSVHTVSSEGDHQSEILGDTTQNSSECSRIATVHSGSLLPAQISVENSIHNSSSSSSSQLQQDNVVESNSPLLAPQSESITHSRPGAEGEHVPIMSPVDIPN